MPGAHTFLCAERDSVQKPLREFKLNFGLYAAKCDATRKNVCASGDNAFYSNDDFSKMRALNMVKKESKPRGWYSRGYLPHFDGGTKLQFLTFRLNDSLPKTVLDKWKNELAECSEIEREVVLRRRIEKYLDCNYGKCYLKIPEAAEIMQNALLYHDGAKYKLIAWTIMPNHVHALLKPFEKLGAIEHSIKSYTANEINKLLNRSGTLWQPEVFDRYIRDYEHYQQTVAYIENNPVKARLCEKAADWQFGSAWFLKNKAIE